MIKTVPASLERARAAVTPALAAAVSTLVPALRRPAEYHLGLTDADGRPIDAGGKHVRAALSLLAASGVGGHETDALDGAVAIELIHNFSLLHDDIIDNDRERRHRPTVWALFGVGPAIVVGDALNLLGVQVLLDSRNANGARAASVLLDATSAMIAGESEDIAFETATEVTVDECLAMSEAKTGALLGCACALGAILGGAPDDVIQRLSVFGVHLGMSFQAVDDVLGIWGDPAVTGKPVFSDLRQHKKSIPIVAALAQANGDERELLALLDGASDSEVVARWAGALIESLGGRQSTMAVADEHFRAAMASLAAANLREPAASELAELARFVVDRDR